MKCRKCGDAGGRLYNTGGGRTESWICQECSREVTQKQRYKSMTYSELCRAIERLDRLSLWAREVRQNKKDGN
jgi:hypothetical protein